MNRTVYQAILFGIVTVLIGLLLSVVFGWMKPALPVECETWNKYYVMEVTLFITGFMLRLLLETEMGQLYLS